MHLLILRKHLAMLIWLFYVLLCKGMHGLSVYKSVNAKVRHDQNTTATF